MNRYQRLGTVEIETVFQSILDHARAPDRFPSEIVVLGAKVGVSGLRLRTFAESPLCCSNPDCRALPTHFAVERNHGDPDDTPEQRPYHLNLYGRNEHGAEVLFTHDHTLARGLGGEDARHNTTSMCLPCNARKGKLESQIANRRRKQEMLESGQEIEAETGPVSEKRLARQIKMLEGEMAHAGMDRETFVAHCDREAMSFRGGHRLNPQEANERRRMAEALGMTVEAYIYLRHVHNERMLRVHGGTPKNQPKPLAAAAVASRMRMG